MSAKVETVGYIFRVSKGSMSFDIISTTELGIGESNEIIRNFFDNFKILRSDKILKAEDAKVCQGEVKIGESGKDKEVEKVDTDKKVKMARKKRNSMQDIWGSLRDSLGDNFTLSEYVEVLKDAGYEYTEASWEAVPAQQLIKLVKLGKIERIEGSKPRTYRKIKVPSSFKTDKDTAKMIKSLKAGDKALIGTIR